MTEPPSEPPWRTEVRAIILHATSPTVLVLRGPAGDETVPTFDLPGRLWSGRPQRFVDAVHALLNLEVALLRDAHSWVDDDERVLRTTLVFAVRDGHAPTPPNGRWIGVDEADGMPDVAAVLDEVAGGRVPAGRVPWRQRAWLGPAQEWIVDSLAGLGRPACGPVEQVRMAELSCVLRAPTGQGDVYFKATALSPLFVNEGEVLTTLAGLFPEYVPAPLAVDVARGWMLLPDLGPEIGWDAPIDVREGVVRSFARLQIRSVDHVDRLLAAGCLDRRPDWLAGQATGWLAGVDLSRWLSDDEAAELRAAGADLARCCAALDELPVPCAIGHGDMHLGNVARRGEEFVFFDWTDACVMHPFVDMIEMSFDGDAANCERLRDAYLDEWASFAPRATLLRAWRLAQPLIALNQAVSYASIASHLEPDADRDGLTEETGTWLRRIIERCRRISPDLLDRAHSTP